MKLIPLALTAFCALAICACNHATATPAELAAALQRALDKGDFDAARKLADIGAAPADLHFFFFDTVRECAVEDTCTVKAAPPMMHCASVCKRRLRGSTPRLRPLTA